MIVWYSLDSDGRIGATTTSEEFALGMSNMEFPDDFDFNKQNDYKIVDGELSYDPLPVQERQLTVSEQMNAVMGILPPIVMRANFTDNEAFQYRALYPQWTIGYDYKKDWIISYNDELYRIGQDHTSQEQWKPGEVGTESLYSHIVIDSDGYEDWKQWDGITGRYDLNQIVRDPEDKKLYRSTISNNTYGPPRSTPDYWELYTE